jgi:hypothetical protein
MEFFHAAESKDRLSWRGQPPNRPSAEEIKTGRKDQRKVGRPECGELLGGESTGGKWDAGGEGVPHAICRSLSIRLMGFSDKSLYTLGVETSQTSPKGCKWRW